MKKSNSALTRLVVTSMLSAVSFVLFLFEFPIFPGAAHLKLDLSDIPALICALLYNPLYGVAVELLKNLLELLVRGFGSQMGFGNLMNFIVGIAFVVPFSLLFKRIKGKKALIVAGLVSIATIVLVGIASNYLITPSFFKFFMSVDLDSKTLWTAIWSATALNAVKGVMLTVVAVVVAPSLRKFTNKYV